MGETTAARGGRSVAKRRGRGPGIVDPGGRNLHHRCGAGAGRTIISMKERHRIDLRDIVTPLIALAALVALAALTIGG